MTNMRYVLRWLFSLVSCILCCGCCCNREEEHHHGHHRVGEPTFKSTKEHNNMKFELDPSLEPIWWDCQFICLIDVITNMNDPAHIFKYGPPCPGANNIGKISFTFPRIWQSFSNTWGKWECLHIEICTFCRLKIQSSPILLAGSSWPPWGETSTGGGPTKRLELDIS